MSAYKTSLEPRGEAPGSSEVLYRRKPDFSMYKTRRCQNDILKSHFFIIIGTPQTLCQCLGEKDNPLTVRQF